MEFSMMFDAPYAPDDAAIARTLLDAAAPSEHHLAAIEASARDLIAAIRGAGGGFGGVEEMLREYALSTREGLALMVLSEALLRVPDGATADRLIEDKLGQGDFVHHEAKSSALLVNASAWALGLSARIIRPGESPDTIIGQLAKRLGLPTLRTATRQAMRVLGNHFVLGQTIDEALERARSGRGGLDRYSFDMLGEGARTAADAERYYASYADAIEAIGGAAGNRPLPERPGISVKLSALHPRFEAVSRARVMRELVPLVLELARKAKGYDLNFTIDAEEADRLEISLDVIAAVLGDASLAGWDGFGLAVQAYQKRAGAVIAWTGELAESLGRRMMVRLVKGAYWDTEIKRAQERGLADYPVFTRKCVTDLNYIACAAQLLALRPRIFPQFATHNALTVATALEQAGRGGDYEFQRLHGMGDALYARLRESAPGTVCRIYAPVGGHRDLLAYLVRRLLENGATPPSCPLPLIQRCRSSNCCAIPPTFWARPNWRATREFRCRRSFTDRRAAIRKGWNSATGRRWPGCSPISNATARRESPQRRLLAGCRSPERAAPRSLRSTPKRSSARLSNSIRAPRARSWGPPRRALRGGRPRQRRNARLFWSELPTCSKSGAASSST